MGVITPPFQISTLDPMFAQRDYDIALIRFLREIDVSLAYQKMLDGMSDNFKDETGIDTVASSGQSKGTNLYVPSGLTVPGILLHGDGADNGTTITDISGKIWTRGGAPVTKTGVKKFGTASLYFPGSANINSPDHNDFYLGTGDWTLDFWIYFPTSVPNALQMIFVQGRTGGYVPFYFSWDGANNRFTLNGSTNGSSWDMAEQRLPATLSPNTWYHVAFVRSGNNLYGFLNGVLGLTNNSFTYNMANGDGIVRIGSNDAASNYFLTAYLDEFHFVKGSALWTADFSANLPSAPYASYNNMSLQSQAFAALSQPSKARLLVFEGDIDTPVLNTDLLGWISRDNGTTWAQVTLAAMGTYASGKNILGGTVDISGQPIGSNMKYKITTPTAKGVNIYGASLLWA